MNSEDIDQLFSKKITMKEIDKYLTENQMDFNGNFEMPDQPSKIKSPKQQINE